MNVHMYKHVCAQKCPLGRKILFTDFDVQIPYQCLLFLLIIKFVRMSTDTVTYIHTNIVKQRIMQNLTVKSPAGKRTKFKLPFTLDTARNTHQ